MTDLSLAGEVLALLPRLSPSELSDLSLALAQYAEYVPVPPETTVLDLLGDMLVPGECALDDCFGEDGFDSDQMVLSAAFVATWWGEGHFSGLDDMTDPDYSAVMRLYERLAA